MANPQPDCPEIKREANGVLVAIQDGKWYSKDKEVGRCIACRNDFSDTRPAKRAAKRKAVWIKRLQNRETVRAGRFIKAVWDSSAMKQQIRKIWRDAWTMAVIKGNLQNRFGRKWEAEKHGL